MVRLNLPQAMQELKIKVEPADRLRSVEVEGYHIKQYFTQELYSTNSAAFVLKWAMRDFPNGDQPTGGTVSRDLFEDLSQEDRNGVARLFIKAGIAFPDWMRRGIKNRDLRRQTENSYGFGFDPNENNQDEDDLRNKMTRFVTWCRRKNFSFYDMHGAWVQLIQERFPLGGHGRRSEESQTRRRSSGSRSSSRRRSSSGSRSSSRRNRRRVTDDRSSRSRRSRSYSSEGSYDYRYR